MKTQGEKTLDKKHLETLLCLILKNTFRGLRMVHTFERRRKINVAPLKFIGLGFEPDQPNTMLVKAIAQVLVNPAPAGLTGTGAVPSYK